MTEWWVSKKNYWCKYCNIWIRDDAPSRKQHETGLKHIGNRERYIRDIYKDGNLAKQAKEEEAIEIAKIEKNAAEAHSKDTHISTYKSRPSLLSTLPSSSSSSSSQHRIQIPKDKFANYSTAKQLGFDDPDTHKTSYEIEQEIKGRGTNVGAWEVVDDLPKGLDSSSLGLVGERKVDEDDPDEFKIQEGKRGREIWEEEDYDLSSLRGMKKKVKSQNQLAEEQVKEEEEGVGEGEGWKGKVELEVKMEQGKGLIYNGEEGGWTRVDSGEEEETSVKKEDDGEKKEEDLVESENVITIPKENTSLFKKRRPPPSRKK
ncbi:hypothetical protein TREMEDRAFT_64085 [Tremella mesenterica DSM 1558]|uniref:uncharacterized protein n=1 Tax=Tremella mesenterica (strain ATCC 24925 / CBS 8224 / DSM 1558 / NBRC 9311 / NRRL Y-6157 / RJB 2259-6 / UBC 559-6) TaxID=578456 RepID=UPI0003F492CF|nr:uncharacterized protein TREMEDRAFT_64085 [Tremella mesenterica DSM 1558]EIW67505.1 hypothetical protein TREMEDRAFT_64085 [Tremella mesenterica DSM 1558]